MRGYATGSPTRERAQCLTCLASAFLASKAFGDRHCFSWAWRCSHARPFWGVCISANTLYSIWGYIGLVHTTTDHKRKQRLALRPEGDGGIVLLERLLQNLLGVIRVELPIQRHLHPITCPLLQKSLESEYPNRGHPFWILLRQLRGLCSQVATSHELLSKNLLRVLPESNPKRVQDTVITKACWALQSTSHRVDMVPPAEDALVGAGDVGCVFHALVRGDSLDSPMAL